MTKMKDRLNRAYDMIKSDRIGVSTGIESAIAREVGRALSDFFSLSSEPNVFLRATARGFEITVKADASSVKSFRTID